MDLIVGLNSYYQSDSENYISTTSQFSEEWGSFWLTSLSATLAADSWSATLYVKNAGNEEGVTGGFPVSYWSYDTGVFENWYGNGARQFIVQPRTIGLKLGYRF